MPYSKNQIGYQKNQSSKEAASFNVKGKLTVREQVLNLFIEHKELTNESVSQLLNRPEISVRPRITELKNMGFLADSGKKTVGKWGTSITIWSYNKDSNND
jgi:predicted HTH transcriptional regulator